MSTPTKRAQLSQFLKSCRARLPPAAVGLPQAGGRRTPGLRREDVASLAGLSATWYTWLEQGRDMRASERVLECLSRTLRLSSEERDYLFSLAHDRAAPHRPATAEIVPDSVKRMLDTLLVPAKVLTRRWDVLYWNEMAAKCLRDYASIPREDRNLIQILLTSADYQDTDEYEAMVRRVTAKLRVDYSQAAGDPSFEAFIDQMCALSPSFRLHWHDRDIASRAEGIHALVHARLGGMTYEHTSYVVEGEPSLRVLIYIPHDETSARKLNLAAAVDADPPRRPVLAR